MSLVMVNGLGAEPWALPCGTRDICLPISDLTSSLQGLLLLRNLLISASIRSRLNCTQCLQHPWLMKDTKNMEAKKLSKDRMKKYMARRKWQVMKGSLWTGMLLLIFAFFKPSSFPLAPASLQKCLNLSEIVWDQNCHSMPWG